MKTSIKRRAALRLAEWIQHRATELRLELENHVRDEEMRIVLAAKRVRGLRLYAAWCRARPELVGHGSTTVLRELTGRYPVASGGVAQST